MKHDYAGRRQPETIPKAPSIKTRHQNTPTRNTRSRKNTVGSTKPYTGGPAEPDDEDPEKREFYELQHIIIFAFYRLCTNTLGRHRKILSLSHDEIQQAIHTAIDAYQKENNTCADGGSSSGADRSGSYLTRNRSARERSRDLTRPKKRPRKRKPDDDDNDDANDGDAEFDPEKSTDTGRGSHWACPFFCSDPVMYNECLRYKFRRLSDLRTHIKRKHMKAPFCPVCGLAFSGLQDTERQAHIRQRDCEEVENPGAQLPGVSQSMWDNMTERAKGRTASNVDKWYEIWDIIFPDCARPPEPFAQTTEIAYAVGTYMVPFLQSEDWEPLQYVRQQLGPHNTHQLGIRFVTYVREQERERRRQTHVGRGPGAVPPLPQTTDALSSAAAGPSHRPSQSTRTIVPVHAPRTLTAQSAQATANLGANWMRGDDSHSSSAPMLDSMPYPLSHPFGPGRVPGGYPVPQQTLPLDPTTVPFAATWGVGTPLQFGNRWNQPLQQQLQQQRQQRQQREQFLDPNEFYYFGSSGPSC